MTNDTSRKYTLARISEGAVASLEDINEGDWVEYSDGNYGVVTGKVDGPLEWPVGDEETETIPDQGDGKQIYIVAKVDGSTQPYTADEISTVDRNTVIGDEDEMPDTPEEDIDDAEMAVGYRMLDGARVAELHRRPLAELISVPGVDDPGVGWDSYPDSWEKSEKPNRLILLDAWSSMSGTFTGCMSEIGSRRICASMKDTVLGTERWRNRF